MAATFTVAGAVYPHRTLLAEVYFFMSINLYTSNRMERLVEALAEIARRPLSHPFVPETIVVQSKGMQRWLAMELAGRFGVWANCRYPFPNAMVRGLFQALLPDLQESAGFSPDVMTWRIMAILPALLGQGAFLPLERYLEHDREGVKLLQLASRIADTFDRYTVYRPELLGEWEAGGGDDWQAVLWRAVSAAGDGRHRARLYDEFLAAAAASPTAGALPERISIFGISYLPRYHMEVFAAAARHCEVNLLLLSPTREYWGDIVSRRRLERLSGAEREILVEGNPLLASLGTLGRDFSETVLDLADPTSGQDNLYRDPGCGCLLHALQSDILNLTGDAPPKLREVAPGDASIQIHSCHSPLREVEVLHDNLLALLEGTAGISPRDIVVMTPDIEIYAPFISAVFEGGDGAPSIPHSIADRNLACSGPIAGTLLKIMNLINSRLPLSQVLDILESPPVARRFRLEDAGLEQIRDWLVDTRVAWGLDEYDRERLGLPAYRENSWRAGLDRLLLGYGLPDRDGELYNGVLPYDEVEGEGGEVLGRLASFLDAVSGARSDLSVPHTLEEWRTLLFRLLEEFIEPDEEDADELAAVRGAIDSTGALAAEAGYEGTAEPAVIAAWLTARLAGEERGYGFITGGVTFCAMLPMRSIPFKVVALIGMGDGAFPRQGRPPGFDLIARHPRKGDRSLRDEDRYLFLESLLSARDCFYLSYVGQSIRDNSELPPSVLVSELLDLAGRGFVPVGGGKLEEHLVTHHALQAFSSSYFTAGSRLFSYSAENCAALAVQRAGCARTRPFLSTPLPPPDEEWLDVPLERLLRFFRNPARFFMEQRMGIRLERAEAPLDEREPFGLDRLAVYGIQQQLLDDLLRGVGPERQERVARCSGLLPPARHGRLLFERIATETGRFAETVSRMVSGGATLPPLDLELELGRFRLRGRLDRIWPAGLMRYRCASTKARDLVSAWIEHLALLCCGADGYPAATRLVMTDRCSSFTPSAAPETLLEQLLELYLEGLTKPLPFFPESSLEYARGGWNIEKARSRWEPSYAREGEGEEPALRLCFREADPFGPEFERIGRTVFLPLLECLE